MRNKKQRLVCLLLTIVLVLSPLAGLEGVFASPNLALPVDNTNLEPFIVNANFRLYYGRRDRIGTPAAADRNTLHLHVLNQNPGPNTITFTTPSTADGWLSHEVGDMYISGLPANSRWLLTVKNITIDVDDNGVASVRTGNLRDIWPELTVTFRRIGELTYTTADFNHYLHENIHPRVWFTPTDIPALQERMTMPDGGTTCATMGFATNWTAINNFANATLPNIGATIADNAAIRNAIEANALLFALGQGDEYGERAIDLARRFGTAYLATNPGNNRQFNRVVRTLSMAYSWTYNHPTMYYDIGGARTEILNAIIGILNRSENDSGFLFPRMSPVSGHGGEEGILYTQLMAGIAIYNEFPALLDFVYNRIMEDFIPIRNWFFRAGSNGMGSGYAPNRFQFDMYALSLLRVFDLNPYNHYMPELMRQTQVWWRFPNGRTVVAGSCFWSYSKAPTSYWNLDSTESWLAATLFNCPVMQWEAHGSRSFRVANDPLLQFILRDNTIVPQSPAIALPLTGFWDGPFPTMVARSAWVENPGMNTNAANANAIVVEMRMPRYYVANHQMLDVGSFQIYYMGWLAITAGDYDSGYWDGGNFPVTPPGHDFNFNRRGISHNLVTVVDPLEEWPAWTTYWASNDGGPRGPNRFREHTSFDSLLRPATAAEQRAVFGDNTPTTTNESQISHLLGANWGGGDDPENAPLFSFMAGDLNPGYTAKINEYQRSMVFLNLGLDSDIPGAFLVFDTLNIRDETYETTWRLHSIDEPQQVAAPEGVAIRSVIDKQPFAGVGYRGRLVNDTLLPLDAELTVIGGPGYHYWIPHFTQSALNRTGAWRHLADNVSPTHGRGHNFVPVPSGAANLVGWPNNRQPSAQKIEDTGGWRIEVTPGAYRNDHEFLNVIQIMDRNNAPATMVPELLEAEGYEDKMVGANIEGWDVWFSRTSDAIATGFTITTSQNAAQLLITGVEAGVWYWGSDGNGVYTFSRIPMPGLDNIYTVTARPFATYLIPGTIDQFEMENTRFNTIFLDEVEGHLPVYFPGFEENLIVDGNFGSNVFAPNIAGNFANITPTSTQWQAFAGGGVFGSTWTDLFPSAVEGEPQGRIAWFTPRANARSGFYQGVTGRLIEAGPGLFEIAGVMRATGAAPTVPEYLMIALTMGNTRGQDEIPGVPNWAWITADNATAVFQPIATDADMNIWYEMGDTVLLDFPETLPYAFVVVSTTRQNLWNRDTQISGIEASNIALRRVEAVQEPEFTRTIIDGYTYITITSTNWSRIYFTIDGEYPQATITQTPEGFVSAIVPGAGVTLFEGPFRINEDAIIRATAIMDGWNHNSGMFSNVLPEIEIDVDVDLGHAFNTTPWQVGYTVEDLETIELTVTVSNIGLGRAEGLRVISTGMFDIIKQPDEILNAGNYTTFIIRPQHGITPLTRSDGLNWTTTGIVTILGDDGISISFDVSFIVDHVFGGVLEALNYEAFIAPDGYTLGEAPELVISLTVPYPPYTGNLDNLVWSLQGAAANNFTILDFNRAHPQGHQSGTVTPVGSDGWVQEVRTTVRPVVGLAPGTHTMTLRANAAKGVQLEIDVDFIVTVAEADEWELISITVPAPIVDLPFGTPPTAPAFGLPARVMLVTDGGNILGDVAWDIAGSPYDQTLAAFQEFYVYGTITLPAGVYNPADVSLTIRVHVTVDAAMTGPGFGDNLIIDGGFENNAFGPQMGGGFNSIARNRSGLWHGWSNTVTRVNDSELALDGSFFGRATRSLVGNTSPTGFYQNITESLRAEGAGLYQISGWMRAVGGPLTGNDYLIIAVPTGQINHDGAFNADWLPGMAPWSWFNRALAANNMPSMSAFHQIPAGSASAMNEWNFLSNIIILPELATDHEAVVAVATSTGDAPWTRPTHITEIHADNIALRRVENVATPEITRDGDYVTITSATPFARIYFTVNGAAPTATISLTPVATGTAFTAPFQVTDYCEVMAIAVLDGWNNSDVAVLDDEPGCPPYCDCPICEPGCPPYCDCPICEPGCPPYCDCPICEPGCPPYCDCPICEPGCPPYCDCPICEPGCPPYCDCPICEPGCPPYCDCPICEPGCPPYCDCPICEPGCPPYCDCPICEPGCPPYCDCPICEPGCPPYCDCPICEPGCPPYCDCPICEPTCPPYCDCPACAYLAWREEIRLAQLAYEAYRAWLEEIRLAEEAYEAYRAWLEEIRLAEEAYEAYRAWLEEIRLAEEAYREWREWLCATGQCGGCHLCD